jgi:hypothetical protein
MTTCIDHVSAIDASAPAVPELIVPASCKIGLLTTALEIATGVPVFTVVPVGFVTVIVVVVDAVIVNVPLLPVAPPVHPEVVTLAPTHAFEPAPVSVAARVYVHTLPTLVGTVLVLRATVVVAPVTVGVVLFHDHAAARAVA